jgi:dienelactone hydrolase
MRNILIYSVLFCSTIFFSEGQEMIKLPSEDGVEIVADLYKPNSDSATFIILFHQAGWSRGEYMEIAPKLNSLGYNCLAIDQRSGNKVNGIENVTVKNARKAMKDTKYVDAFQDIEATVSYVKKYLAKGKVIIWGSSYSSALVLKYAGDNPNNIQGVLAFSPGEYFKSMGKPGDYIQSSATKIKCPSFITSAKSEKGSWWKIYESISTDVKSYYLPETSGNHGSRALWQKFSDNEGYWDAVKSFLSKI